VILAIMHRPNTNTHSSSTEAIEFTNKSFLESLINIVRIAHALDLTPARLLAGIH
jgi:hypothetical protein